MPDRPQVTVGAGRRPPVPGRRRRAAEAEQRPRALGGEAERPRTLDLRLPRAGGLEQDLTQQLVGWLDDCGRPALQRHRVLERRRLPQQRDRVVPGPIRLPQQRPQLLFEDARHAVFLRAGVDRGTHLTEGHEVRQVALGARAVATLDGAEPEDERVHRLVPETRFGEIDLAPLQRPTVPALGVHDVVGAHQGELGALPRPAPVHVLVHQVEVSQRVPVPTLLQIAVAQPGGVMVGRPGGAVAPRRELVLRHYLIPHPQREEDVGGHVLRVRGVGRDHGIRPGRRQTERRTDRVVVAMDQEVRRARVVRVVPEYLFSDGGGPQVRRHVPHPLTQAEQGERVEDLGFAVRGEARDQPLQGERVRRVSLRFRAVAVEDFDGFEIRLLPGRRRLGAPGGGRRAEALEGCAGGAQVLLVPDRMRVGERLAPIGEGESGIEALRLAESLRRVPVLEAVQQQHTADELRLSRRGSRRGKLDRPEVGRLGRHRRPGGEARQRRAHEPPDRASHAAKIHGKQS